MPMLICGSYLFYTRRKSTVAPYPVQYSPSEKKSHVAETATRPPSSRARLGAAPGESSSSLLLRQTPQLRGHHLTLPAYGPEVRPHELHHSSSRGATPGAYASFEFLASFQLGSAPHRGHTRKRATYAPEVHAHELNNTLPRDCNHGRSRAQTCTLQSATHRPGGDGWSDQVARAIR